MNDCLRDAGWMGCWARVFYSFLPSLSPVPVCHLETEHVHWICHFYSSFLLDLTILFTTRAGSRGTNNLKTSQLYLNPLLTVYHPIIHNLVYLCLSPILPTTTTTTTTKKLGWMGSREQSTETHTWKSQATIWSRWISCIFQEKGNFWFYRCRKT